MYLPYKCFINPDKQSLLLQKTESMPVRCAFFTLYFFFCRLIVTVDFSALPAEKSTVFLYAERADRADCPEARHPALSQCKFIKI